MTAQFGKHSSFDWVYSGGKWKFYSQWLGQQPRNLRPNPRDKHNGDLIIACMFKIQNGQNVGCSQRYTIFLKITWQDQLSLNPLVETREWDASASYLPSLHTVSTSTTLSVRSHILVSQWSSTSSTILTAISISKWKLIILIRELETFLEILSDHLIVNVS